MFLRFRDKAAACLLLFLQPLKVGFSVRLTLQNRGSRPS